MKCRDLLPGDMYITRISQERTSAWLIIGRRITLDRGEIELIIMNCWEADRSFSGIKTQIVDVFSNVNETVTVMRDGNVVFKGQRSS